ncbi:UDP-N-acetylmuramoyl-L-alanine--D-glutamate ligase [Patescibacteria group bacterium]|nr:UDP-N-acetylmuramoyl-L-alanine--D-glutamate ligase [Patescibacteria group bacterium]MBU1890759.1 UDP-N-acetylmuramoyl-L-alanine--D-glutamate ligase [Patescibacteria group bacterium]
MKHSWKNKRVTVMGLGLHGGGVSVARFFVKQGAKVTVTDLRPKSVLKPSLAKLQGLKIEYVLGKHRPEDFIKADLIVQNPGVPSDSRFLKIALEHEVPIENEASIFFSLVPAPIIGITGTKGKSTVTTLVGQILKSHKPKTVVAGNIRTSAMLDVLPQIKKDTPVVLELSSWQLEGLDKHKVSPTYALVTNILSDHMNRYATAQDYYLAKSIIFKYQAANDAVILNYDNAGTRQFSCSAKGQIVWFSLSPLPKANMIGAFVNKDKVVYGNRNKNKSLFNIADVKVPGQHNLANILAAVALTKSIGVPDKNIITTIKKFKGLLSRLEYVATVKKIKFINDTTATSPIATQTGLKAFEKGEKIILIAGGQDKSLDYRSLGREIDRSVMALLLFPGTASQKIRRSVRKAPIYSIKNMRSAVNKAYGLAQPGTTVLLSPASASFNMFKNEFDRGEQFIKAVEDL